MRATKIDENIFFSFGYDGEESRIFIEETIAKYIIDMCRIKDMSITVKADFDDIRKALWDGLHYAVMKKDEKVCSDIARCMEYINGLEMKSDESI